MTRIPHLLSMALLAVGLGTVPAAAQTVIGDTSQPAVEVNLDVLNGLGTGSGATTYDSSTESVAASTSGSVLLIAPTGGTTATAPASSDAEYVPANTASVATTTTTGSTGSVLLLEQPATQPAASSDVFVFPSVPETKPSVPEASGAATTTTTTTTTTVTQPEPEPEVVTTVQPEPEVVTTSVAEETTSASGTLDVTTTTTTEAASDPFAQLDTMLDEPVAPDQIEVPEPDMTMEGAEVAAIAASEAASQSGLDLQLIFEPGADEITDSDRTMLQDLAQRLAGDENQRIQLRAYASSADGTDSAARRLALSRALQVRAYLIENNVRSTRIDVRALGDKVEGSGPLDRIDVVLVDN